MKLGETKPTNLEIYPTTQYDLFEMIPCNRPIYPSHLKRLTEAIKERNMLDRHPIRVTPDGEILDGQYRFLAAKELGVPIYYYIDQDDLIVEDIAIEATYRKGWMLVDVLNLHVVRKASHYCTLKGFVDKHPWMTVSVAVAVCQGKQSNSYIKGKARRDFIGGKYKITDMAYAMKFASAIGDFMEYINFAKHKKFMQTVSYLLRHPSYDHDRMMAQMDRAGHMLTKQFTKDDYLRVMEKIYNYRKTEKFRERFF